MTKSRRKHPTFADGMTMMRSRDPQAQEDGFGIVQDQVNAYVAELVDAFHLENERGLKSWLLELLASAREPSLTALFVAQLNSADESLRHWAEVGLRKLHTKEARTALFAAGRRG
jgi:hypothetical protein